MPTCGCMSRSVCQTETNDAPERLKTILPADFFSFCVGTAGVTDRDLIDSVTPTSDSRCHLRFKTKSLLHQFGSDLVHDMATEYLVTGFHIGEIQIGKTVGKSCQKTIAQVVPEIEDSMCLIDPSINRELTRPL